MSTAIHADVAVVGAGPAGIAAALAAADLGCQVILVDASAAIGGQIYRQPAVAGSGSAVHGVSRQMPRRLRRAASHGRIRHLAETIVWHAQPPGPGPHAAADDGSSLATTEFELRLKDTTSRAAAISVGPDLLRARAVVVATGATEITAPFPGWDLPGVTTAGAAQALLKGQGVVAGHRVLVAGSGPLLLPAAATLAAAGVQVVAVLEATPAWPAVLRAAALLAFPGKVAEAAAYAAMLAKHRVPVLPSRAVTACHGTERVQHATISRLTRNWRPMPGTARRVAVDAVHVSLGFCPSLELPRLLGCADVPLPGRPAATVWHDADLATSVPGVFAAGETTGVAGAEVAELEGYIAGAAAARYLRRITPDSFGNRTARVRAALIRARRFAAVLDRLYPYQSGWMDWPRPDTIACRCEEVPWSAIGEAVAVGANDVRAVKGMTRCGMGYCQGRVCGPILQQAVAAATGRGLSEVGDLHARPLLAPTPLGAIAATAAPSGPEPGKR